MPSLESPSLRQSSKLETGNSAKTDKRKRLTRNGKNMDQLKQVIGREEAKPIQLAQACQTHFLVLDMIECDSHRMNELVPSNVETLPAMHAQSHLHTKALEQLKNTFIVRMKMKVHRDPPISSLLWQY